ncbi:MAG: hypothetical protein ACOH5I_18800 [Oligoflexus sp.]
MSTPKLPEKLEASANSPVIICMTHEDGNSLPAILQRLSSVWKNQRRIASDEKTAHSIGIIREHKETSCEIHPGDKHLEEKFVRKIEAQQQQARSQLQQSEQLKRLSRQILEDNKKMMSRSLRFNSLHENKIQ